MPIVSAALVWLCATAAIAPPAVKQEIVVTAAREEQPRDQASAALTVFDKRDLQQLPAMSLAEVLAAVPGVTMMFDGGASGIPMLTSRGFFGGGEVEYVKLLVDGVPAGDAESGNVDWQRFRASEIERVEVLHGPGSALYGDTALGGVIQVFTSHDDDSDGELRAAGGSFGALDLGATYRAELANGFRLDANAGSWNTDGFRENADANGRDAHVALEHLADAARWRVDGEYGRTHRQQPGALTRAEIAENREQSSELFRFDGQTTSRERIGAAFDSFGSTPLHATLYALRRDDDNLRTLLLAPGFGTSAFRALRTNVAGGTFEASREWAHGIVRGGADLEHASIDGSYAAVEEEGRIGEMVASSNGTRDRIGLFVTGAWSFAQRYHFTAGVRRDDIRDEMSDSADANASAWSPRLGLNVTVGAGASLFVQVSSAFKAATLDQLFDRRPYPDGSGGTFTISNPNLRPQRARNVEAGLSRTTLSSDWSVVAYRMNVRDEIDFDPQTFTYKNIGTSQHRGVEASAAFAKNARVSPRFTYAWTHVADGASPDVQLKAIPEHTAQLMLHWRATSTTSADALYRWRDRVALDDAHLFSTPSVSRVDLRVTHDLRGVTLHADVLNALAARYSELGYVLADFTGQPTPLEFPAPGRTLRLGVTWTFARKGK
ncbi:MAG TPA: TonB-dependent receptor [Thermoanaerobaculia bacterium]|nr:TonB-dependent receptor [Thermoanaerobaculia bacterium]